jgi:hypothetical protein
MEQLYYDGSLTFYTNMQRILLCIEEKTIFILMLLTRTMNQYDSMSRIDSKSLTSIDLSIKILDNLITVNVEWSSRL